MKQNGRYDVGLLILRLGLGLIMLYYGSQKMFGVFGGHGYTSQIGLFQGQGIPPVFGHLAIAGEFFGALGVLLGFLTPIAAFGIACVMAVATYKTITGATVLTSVFVDGNPMESAHLYIAPALFFLAVGIMVMGAGRFSLDSKFFGRKGK